MTTAREDKDLPQSAAASTLVPSHPASRASSLHEKKAVRLAAKANGDEETGAHVAVQGRTKDRAPAFVVVLCLFQSLAGLLFGWESGIIAGLQNLRDYQTRFGEVDPTSVTGYRIPTIRSALIVAFMGLGALFGSLMAGRISSKTGIKVAFLSATLVYAIGAAIETSAQHSWVQILIGRLVTGYGVGALSMLAPLFQAECSPRHLRGIITSTYQLAATIGIFLSNVVNYSMRNKSGAITWRLNLGLEILFGGLLFIGTSFCPESPMYYCMRGNVQQARKNLAKLRDLPIEDAELDAELQDIQKRIDLSKASGEMGYLDCFKSQDRMRNRTLIGIGIQAAQQWSGVNFFFSYGVSFFASAGISDSFLTQMILSAVNVITTFPGLVAVEKLGRRLTLLIGCLVMFLGQVIAGALATAYPGQEAAGKALIFFSCLFIFGFASTIGPLGWVVAAEQTSVGAEYVLAWATGSNWFNNALLAFITPLIMNEDFGNVQSKITFLWAAAIAASAVFIYLCVPETKGLSLIQVDELYLSHVPAWRSAKWVPTGGLSARNTTTQAQALKLSSQSRQNSSHHEVATLHAPKRDLTGDDASV